MYTICMYVCSEAAVASGARIVHFCGHDCIPWDLCVQQLAKALKQKEKDETLAEVRTYVCMYIFNCIFSRIEICVLCISLYCVYVCMYICMYSMYVLFFCMCMYDSYVSTVYLCTVCIYMHE